MRSIAKKLLPKWAAGILLSLFIAGCAGCQGSPKIEPHIVDFQTMSWRQYDFTSDYSLVYKGWEPITPNSKDSYGQGFICAPYDQAAKFRQWWINKQPRTK